MSHSALLRTCFASATALLWLAACNEPRLPTDTAPAVRSASLSTGASAEATQLVALRQVTARFANFDAGQAAGYVSKITSCWEHATHGAMGYHYANLNLFDATADLLQPEALMYEPNPGGQLRLVGMEYIIPLDAWAQAGHDLNDPEDVPVLVGQPFTRHSTLPIFKLHIWLWRNNPQGTYADWNPKVSCASASDTEIFQ
jgi:hypothetical protein